jgi:hypothetical protein
MADLKLSTYTRLMTSLNAVKAASDEMTAETRDHAEAHFAHLDALRKQQEHTKAINDGIERSAG